MAGNFNQPTLVNNPFEVGSTTKSTQSVLDNVLNRNPNLNALLNPTSVFIKPTENELQEVRRQYDNATSASNYLIGTQQLINKSASEGILSNLLPNELQQDAAWAYRDNQRELDKTRDYRSKSGISNLGLDISTIAPELAVELGLLIPAAKVAGAGLKAIGAADKLAKLGRTGKVIEESAKWGAAEVPISYLLGEQEHLGERVAMSALGAGAIEGVIQGVGHLAGKVKGSPEMPLGDATTQNTGKTIDDITQPDKMQNRPIYEPNKDISEDINLALAKDEATTGGEALASQADSGVEAIIKNEVKPIDESFTSHIGSVKSMNVSEALKNMSSGKYKDITKQEQQIAREFENLHLKRKVDYEVKLSDELPTGRYGQSTMMVDNTTNTIEKRMIELNSEKASNKLLLHEIAHQQSAEFTEIAKRELAQGLITKNTKAYNSLDDLMYRVEKSSGSKQYGFKNVDEFISEAFSNPEFQDILKSYKINKQVSLWDKVVQYVKDLIGLKSNNDALSQVMTISKERFDNTFNRGIKTNESELVKPFNKEDVAKTTENINQLVSTGIDKAAEYTSNTAKSLYANPAIKSVIDEGLSIGKLAKDTISELANKNKLTKAIKDSISMPDESFGSFLQNLNVLVDKSMKAKMFTELARLTSKGEKTSIEVGNSIRSYIKQMMSDLPDGGFELRNAFTKHYLYTDFQSIKDLGITSVKEARDYVKSNIAVFSKFKREIDQGAMALKDRGAMNSKYYYDNAMSIAKSKGVTDEKTIDIIDKLISVRSLSKEDLDFINKYKSESWFEEMSDMASSFSKESDSIFKSTPHSKVKGYYKEIYGKDLYSHDFDLEGIDHKTLKLFNRPEYTKGALPVNPNKKAIGSEIVNMKDLSSQDPNVVRVAKDKIDSFDGKLRTVRTADGEILSWNRVLPEIRRVEELNKNLDSADILAASYQSLYKKRGVEESVKYLKSDKEGTLLEYVDKGQYPKSGYVPLDKKDLSILDKRLLPEEWQKLFVPQDFKHMMVGNEAIGFTEAKSIQNAFMNVMKDATEHFKHSVIIANARAYLVNYVGAYTASLRAGMSHKEIMSSFREANNLYKTMRQDLNELYVKSTTGRSTASVEARLKDNPLFQMKDNGLAMTMVHDYMAHTGNRSVSHDIAEKGLQKLYKLMGQTNEHPLKYKDILGLEEGTKGGEIASLVMARFDVYGRYALVKKALSKGNSMDEAVNEANSIFGDSNLIAPRIIQLIDSVPVMPFATWMFRVFAGNVKASKENFVQSLGIYLTFKALSSFAGYNLNSGDSTQIPLSPIQAMDRYDVSRQIGNVNPFHPLPYMDQAGKLLTEENPLGVLFSTNK